MAQLKRLDLGYGYTADGGKTFPFRGRGVGLMHSLDEVLAGGDEPVAKLRRLLPEVRTASRGTLKSCLLGSRAGSTRPKSLPGCRRATAAASGPTRSRGWPRRWPGGEARQLAGMRGS